MTEPESLARADRLGFAASFLCAIHCAVLPLVLAFLPTLGLKLGGWIDIDQAFVVFATLLGTVTLTLGYRRHGRYFAWLLLVPGLLLVWMGAFGGGHVHDLRHATIMVSGGLMLAGAHFVNLRLSHTRTAEKAN